MAKVRKSGLGKGLDTLIPENVDSKMQKEEKAKNILNINEIEPNRAQPRKNFDEDSLSELAESIKQVGVIQPIIVQKRDGYYEIIAGERRWRAAKLAQIKEVPVVIKDYTKQEILEVALIENIQRQDLNPIEEALAYKNLIEEFSLVQDNVAKRVGKSRVAITNSMRLLKLQDEIQNMVAQNIISSGHARALLSIDDKTEQLKAANIVVEKAMSVRDTEKLVKLFSSPESENKKQLKKLDNEFVYKDIENKIKDIIGTKVKINRKTNNKGKIEIEYYSNEELERIVELIERMQ